MFLLAQKKATAKKEGKRRQNIRTEQETRRVTLKTFVNGHKSFSEVE